MTPKEIIAGFFGASCCEDDPLVSAVDVIEALQNAGWYLVRQDCYPLTISTDYTVHTNGDAVVM